MERKLIRVDRNGTKYYTNNGVCPRCNGHKRISQFHYNEGGICFLCGGTGFYAEKWKEYTPEYQAKLDAKKLEKAKANVPSNNAYFLKKYGFNEEGYTYVVLGETYSIKDQLKKQGAQYSKELGWHFDTKKENTIEVSVDEIAHKDDIGEYHWNEWYEVKNLIKAKKQQAEDLKKRFMFG